MMNTIGKPKRIRLFALIMHHSAPHCNKSVHTYAHFYYKKLVHGGVWDRCIAGSVKGIHCWDLHAGALSFISITPINLESDI